MRIVEVIKQFSSNGQDLRKGHSYVMAEDIEAQYRSLNGDCMGMSHPVEKMYRPYKGEDLTGKKLMCWRTGGIGDILFLNPVLRWLKKKYPTMSLRVASACKQSLECVPEVDELYDMPFDSKLLEDTDYHLMFQGIIESSSDASKRTHAVDMFFSYFSIDSTHLPDEDKRPALFFNDGERDWLARTLKELGVAETDFLVGVQMESSSPLRNYPQQSLKAVVDTLARDPGVKVAMIGSEQHDLLAGWYKGNSPNILAATKFSVRQSMVLAQRYNLVISPDSFMVQVAGALGKPLIGLYGPFPSEVRMKYFRNAVGLDPSVACSPCFKHDFRACIRGFPSPCFTQVSVGDVLQAADALRFKTSGRHFAYMAESLREPDLREAEKFMMGADKGLCFFPGLWRHPNAISVDPNPFVKAEVSNLSTEFKREAFPFVLYMNEFSGKHNSVYGNCKSMVRPGGYFIVYRREANEQLAAEIRHDVGQSFVIIHSKFDPATRDMLIIGKKQY